MSSSAARSLALLLSFSISGLIAADNPPPIPEHQSHTVGWQRVLIVCGAGAGKKYGLGSRAPVPDAYRAKIASFERTMNVMLAAESFYRIGIKTEIFPKIVGHLEDGKTASDQSQGLNVSDAMKVDPAFDFSQYDRIWLDHGAGGGQASLETIWCSTGDWSGAGLHEFMHSCGVEHPSTYAGGDGTQHPGPCDKIRMKWLTETDPNGFRFTDVVRNGIYRVHCFHAELSHSALKLQPGGMPGVIPGGDRALKIANSPICVAMKSIGSYHTGMILDRHTGHRGGFKVPNIAPTGAQHDPDILVKGESYTMRLWGDDASNTRKDRVRFTVTDLFRGAPGQAPWCDVRVEFLDGEPLHISVVEPRAGAIVPVGQPVQIRTVSTGVLPTEPMTAWFTAAITPLQGGTPQYFSIGSDDTHPFGTTFTPSAVGNCEIFVTVYKKGTFGGEKLAYTSPHRFVVGASEANRPPTATSATRTVASGSALPITLTGSDPDGDALTYAITKTPAHGTLTGTGNQRKYTPKSGFAGTDTFAFTVSDGKLTSAPATITIQVQAVQTALVDTIDLIGGTLTARGEHVSAGEGRLKAIDNRANTKWLDFTDDPFNRSSWLVFTYAQGTAQTVTAWSITSANDEPARDPADVQLLGSNDQGVTWRVVDRRTGLAFSQRHQRRVFQVAAPKPFKLYSLEILKVANPARANSVQLAEWELLAPPPSAAN